jgi:hypothetical protein
VREFFDQAFSMPTAAFSVLLVLVVLYWSVKLLSGLDLFGTWLEGAEGVAEGGLDAALDAEAVGEGSREGGHGRGWVRLLGLGEVPVVLVLSLLIAFGWAFSLGGSVLASKLAIFAAGGAGVVLLVAFASLGLALLMTMVAVTPLRRLMRFVPATELRQLVGKTARVTTQRVDERFGQAEVADLTGAPILIQARARLPNGIRRGDLVRVGSYDARQETFLVAPVQADAGATNTSSAPATDEETETEALTPTLSRRAGEGATAQPRDAACDRASFMALRAAGTGDA